MAARSLTADDRRHLLRRLCFAATPGDEMALRGLDSAAALDALWSGDRDAAQPVPPAFAREPWTNTALPYTTLRANRAAADYEPRRAAQLAVHQRQIEQLRQAWIDELVRGPARLRENLVLFFHGLFGSSSAAVEIPQALEARNALLRRACMTSVPELLAELVLDPAMLIQIGMDGHGPDRVSDRPAKLILEHWTVGAGAYGDADVAELSRALTGWTLGPADPSRTVVTGLDPRAPKAARRLGLVPRFDTALFEAGPKTLLGVTADFDARSALRFLATQPAAARRFAAKLLRHFGVTDPNRRLEAQLEAAYLASGGSMRELLLAMVDAEEFWSDASRWELIKSPVHLAAGACRQLEIETAPVAELSRWLTSCGQTLFDTPNNGEGGWADQEAWISPPDRLALRYQLPAVLAPARAAGTETSAAAWLERLDPAPGIDLASLRGRNSRNGGRRGSPEWLILATPQYQLA